MFRGSFLRVIAPNILRSPDEAGGGPVERPDHIPEDQWEGLTEAEREGIVSTDEGEGANQIIGTGEEFEGEQTNDGDLSDEELASVLADEKPAGETATETQEVKTQEQIAAEAAGTTETSEEVIVADEVLVGYRPEVSNSELAFPKEVPPEIQTKLDDLGARRDKADEFFDNQEDAAGKPFTRKDYNAALREIERERETVKDELTEFKITTRDAQRDTLVWKKECDAFFSARREYGDTEKGTDGQPILNAAGKPVTTVKAESMTAALNAQVKRIGSLPGAAAKSGMQILVEADKAVREAFGLPAIGKATAKPVSAKPEEKPSAADRKDLESVATKVLSGTPIAEGENTDSMAKALSRLSGERLEQALEKLTPAQRAALESQV
jgi:hypothetical protein